MRRHSKLSAIALAAILAACSGVFTTLRVGLAASRPLADSLVAAGEITQKQADVVIADFDEGAKCGETLQADFKAIPKDLPKQESRARKFEASQKAYRCFRVVVDRHNFALHPRFQKAANIADGILASLVLFYGGNVAPSEAAAAATINAPDEKALEQQIKAQMKALEKAMQP